MHEIHKPYCIILNAVMLHLQEIIVILLISDYIDYYMQYMTMHQLHPQTKCTQRECISYIHKQNPNKANATHDLI